VNNIIHSVVYRSHPFDYYHDRYQSSYIAASEEFIASQGAILDRVQSGWPGGLKALRRIRYSGKLERSPSWLKVPAEKGFANLAHVLGAESPKFPAVGRYELVLKDGRRLPFVVDSRDTGDIDIDDYLNPPALYFKANYWINREYPKFVLPLHNANPAVYKSLTDLKASRKSQIEYDFCVIMRVWGGSDETSGIEHCMRILETLSRSPRKKLIIAYLVAGDKESQARRLAKSNIQAVTDFIPTRQLWSATASSRLNVIRLGIHHCVPWRMFDLLAMGAGPVLDQAPKTIWPTPLVQNRHFGCLGLNTNASLEVNPPEIYEEGLESLENLLANTDLVSFIRNESANYFDSNLSPSSAGGYIINNVLKYHNITEG